ncbi:hypothetical protein C8F01DRAFT_1221839 [Mycena amicta]|nr:hypothetical protein C8F01DRAFT_1221839 [Mycena amicta]
MNCEEDASDLTLYIAGTSEVDCDGEYRAAGGIWINNDHPKNVGVCVPDGHITRTSGTLAAMLYAIQSTANSTPMNFVLDSKDMVKKLTLGLPTLEANGYTGDQDKKLLRVIVAALRTRANNMDSIDQAMIKHAIEVAQTAFTDPTENYFIDGGDLHLDVPIQYQIQGSTFYAALLERLPYPERMKTTIMLDITCFAVHAQGTKIPTDEEIWLSTRSQDFLPSIQDFMWKTIHQTYKIGEQWLHIPSFEHWANCPTCHLPDSMAHALLECSAPGSHEVWALCKQLWELKTLEMPMVSLGLIVGIGLCHVKDENGKRLKGAERLLRILVSESAFIIWKLRCEQLMSPGGLPHSKMEVHNYWVAQMNKRLKLDQLASDASRFGAQATDKQVVLQTWEGVLMDNKHLPNDWVGQSEVLVGIAFSAVENGKFSHMENDEKMMRK